MSYADKVFIEMCRDIIDNGTSTEGEKVRPVWEDGTSAYTIKKFGVVNRYDHSKTSADWFPSRMFPSTTVMTIPWYYPTFPSRFRQENPLPLPVRQEAEKLRSAPFCQDFMM